MLAILPGRMAGLVNVVENWMIIEFVLNLDGNIKLSGKYLRNLWILKFRDFGSEIAPRISATIPYGKIYWLAFGFCHTYSTGDAA